MSRSGCGRRQISHHNQIAMSFVFIILCFTLTFAHTVNGSPGDGFLCPVSEYIDDNQEIVNEYYECPDPKGDPARTACCEESDEDKKLDEGKRQNYNDLRLSIFKGDTQEKCCLPKISLDSVLKVRPLFVAS